MTRVVECSGLSLWPISLPTYTPGVAGLLLKHSVRLACLSSISRREDTDPRHKFSTAPALSCAVIMLPCYHDQRSFCTRHSTLHVMNGVASAYDNQEGARRAMHILSSHLVRTDWTYSLSSLLSLIIFLLPAQVLVEMKKHGWHARFCG